MNIKNRIPFIFIEMGKLYVNNGQLTTEKAGIKEIIDPVDFCCVVLGKGTSITQDAVKMLQKTRTLLFFSGYKMSSIMMYSTSFHAGSLRNTQRILSNNNRSQVKIAKKLIKYRNSMLPSMLQPMKINFTKINEALQNEAVWTKKTYKIMSRVSGQQWISKKYANQNRHPMILINKLLYSLSLIAIISLGLDPSLGVLHTKRRDMGLVFDLADVFKPKISWEPAFLNKGDEKIVWGLINELQIFKKMIMILEDIYRR